MQAWTTLWTVAQDREAICSHAEKADLAVVSVRADGVEQDCEELQLPVDRQAECLAPWHLDATRRMPSVSSKSQTRVAGSSASGNLDLSSSTSFLSLDSDLPQTA